ncbi:PBECR4 domain-containing protein [Stomatobaculum sp. F0698]|uniref:PBECR4 domain-containing protein n=1 Tax=Stomatobaculum sp. F0698 TaxID=3059030 RepID=UPI00272C29EB|nr:PBECR4 domain-containing protein [Stomatobaculum sp. F0698]WLD86206.1 PBECR4 domain-containing protein [Stomatobaculum sp. F0698]
MGRRAGEQRKNQPPRGNISTAVPMFPLEILGENAMKISKRLATRIIVCCAREYHNNLENRNLLIVYGSPSKPDFFETIFLPSNFLHLTGVRPVSDKILSSSVFYQKAMNGILNPNDFSMAVNGTTERKLSVLPWLTKVHLIAKMVGTYNPVRSMQYTDKLVGNTKAFLGFIFQNGFYIPNTAREGDIRNFSLYQPQKVLAIFRKHVDIGQYQELCYIAKGLDVNTIVLPRNIKRCLKLPTVGATIGDFPTRVEIIRISHTDPGNIVQVNSSYSKAKGEKRDYNG